MDSGKTRAALFLNSAAASGRSRLGNAATLLASHFRLAVHSLPNVAAMQETAAHEARQGCRLMIAAGGDGTVNALVNALAGTEAALGILPVGTGNDFARQIGIPRNAEDAARRIIAGRTKRFDLVGVNGRRFCTVGGVGLIADCAKSANRLRSVGHPFRGIARRLGAGIYPAIAVSKILLGESNGCEWSVTWKKAGSPDSTLNLQGPGIFVANQRGLGGGLTLPVEGNNADGTIELCLVNRVSRFRLLQTLLALKQARAIQPDVIEVRHASWARIESSRELAFLGDGELLCVGRHFELEVLANALEVAY